MLPRGVTAKDWARLRLVAELARNSARGQAYLSIAAVVSAYRRDTASRC
jgi:hypothetical protein